QDQGYGTFKGDLAEVVEQFLIDFQDKYRIFYESDELYTILDAGRDKARQTSFKTLKKMEKAMGLVRKRK
ncbi:tryptophan--tRNA ligase, partial [Staphylococcus felis]